MYLKRGKSLLLAGVALAALQLASPATAQEKVLNLYTTRHYQTDEALYNNFTRQTGIRINRIEGGEDALFERIRNEGARSPADVFITVDVGRIWRADEAGIYAPVKSKLLDARIPASLRDPDGKWYGFSTRARAIIYSKESVKAGDIRDYEDLADPKWKNSVCIRSSSHPYNLSLIASMIAHHGESKAEEWVRGLKANLARDPKGGDTDQLMAVAAGECRIAVTNTYYIARLMRSAKPNEKAAADKLAVVLPNAANRGTHVNISGGGMLKHAPNKDAAVKFLEYLAGDEAQRYFADGNNEWPAVASVKVTNPAMESFGPLKVDSLNLVKVGQNQPAAQRIADRSGFK